MPTGPAYTAHEFELLSAIRADSASRLEQLFKARPGHAKTVRVRHDRLSWATPVWVAVEKGSRRALGVLLQYGAPDTTLPHGLSAFQWAASRHDDATVAVFEQHGRGGPLSFRPGDPTRTGLACALETMSGEVSPLVNRWLDTLCHRRGAIEPHRAAFLLQCAIKACSPSLLPRLLACGIKLPALPSSCDGHPLREVVRAWSSMESRLSQDGVVPSLLPAEEAEFHRLRGWVRAMARAGLVATPAVFEDMPPNSDAGVIERVLSEHAAASLDLSLPPVPSRRRPPRL